MEWKIGEIRQLAGEWYQCVEGSWCLRCDFHRTNLSASQCDYRLYCLSSKRKDGKSVIFKKLEKVGGPFTVGRELCQHYKVFDIDNVCGDVSWNVHNYKAKTILIELKQTEEDMEEKKENVYIVYKHISPTGKEYVGMTHNIKKRWEGNGCSYKKNAELKNDIMKYGWDNFQHLIIKDGLSLSEASKLEDELIVDAMNRGVAYNIARGGIGGSHPAWNKGMSLSEEQKAKLATANKGKKLSDETKRKIGEASRGHVVSEETKRKIGDKNRGKKHSKEHMKKWTESNRWRFCKIEIKKDGTTIGVYESKREASRVTGLSRGFINYVIKRPNGKHQGYTIIILD